MQGMLHITIVEDPRQKIHLCTAQADSLPVEGGVIHEKGDVVFAIGVGGLQVDQHPEDGCQQLVQPGFCWQGKARLPFLHSNRGKPSITAPEEASLLHCPGCQQLCKPCFCQHKQGLAVPPVLQNSKL